MWRHYGCHTRYSTNRVRQYNPWPASDSTQSLIYSQSQTRIRQHAMRMYLQKKSSNVSSDAPTTESVLQPQSVLASKFRSKRLLKKGKAKQMKSVSKAKDNGDERGAMTPITAACIMPAISKIDPFQVLPIKMDPSQEHLLKVSLSFFSHNIIYSNIASIYNFLHAKSCCIES